MQLEIQLDVLWIFDAQDRLPSGVFPGAWIDQGELALPEYGILHINAKKQRMGEFDGVDGTDASLPEKIWPVFSRGFVVNFVLEVIGQEILELDGGRQSHSHIRVCTVHVSKHNDTSPKVVMMIYLTMGSFLL
jgi:hypothetical protein